MRIRSIPDLQQYPAFKGRFIVDTFRGQIRVRSWPRKQTQATKDKNQNRIRWFIAAREMAKYAEPNQIAVSKEATKGTGIYPADLQMMAAAGNLIPSIKGDPDDYTKWQPTLGPIVFQGVRLPLNADQAKAAGGSLDLIWALPDFTTGDFWNPAAPTLLTIPANVSKVIVWAGLKADMTSSGNVIFRIINSGSGGGASFFIVQGADIHVAIPTGPIAVAQGDELRANLFSQKSGTIEKSANTFFALQVVEAS